uniref:Uncharacterized protein n=1 Tax=Branchiostoma floridae TaxID=7739 RepID=C3YL66_BRAFL|eukprot:XP_002602924.1 hypothetical protein BRAFLDRAFT_62487 [Branchiostoma floridae]
MSATPPSYGDLGKSARDTFGKGYGFGFVKLDCKTTTSSGVEFSTSGTSNNETGKVGGELETKYKWKDYGLTFTEKWNTDNTLASEIKIEDQIAKGLSLTFDTKFSPSTGKKSGQIKTAYKMDYLNVGADVDLDFAGPTIHGAAVLGNDGTEFGGSIYQKVNNNLETGVNLAWTAGSNNTRFGLAAKYTIDSKSSFRAKVNNSSQIGLGYTQEVRPGVKVTLSTLLDGKNFNQGGHKLGLGLDLEA